ncbi:MAG: SpoIIE family protein phosphatase [Bacteroidales bacterium]|nr:SpoIIE family protein phosphatase [Bacteroidales bacterium]
MDEKIHIEVNCKQKNHWEERICGDVFLSKRIRSEDRTIIVLSDGMGHGVKANILATLTATMALNFTEEHADYVKTAETIINTLPARAEGVSSYATFTIIDINAKNEVAILEYGNPETTIIRGKKIFDPGWETVTINTAKIYDNEIHFCKFQAYREDRIVFCSDGVTQSGLGYKYTMGWGREAVVEYAQKLIADTPDISASTLASKIVTMAQNNDMMDLQDDTSCAVVYFRYPRRLLICTGPPFDSKNDRQFAQRVADFKEKIIICGATTSQIISRELNRKITYDNEIADPTLPPISMMEGIELVTEGTITLNRVAQILKTYRDNHNFGKGPADLIIKHLLNSEIIDMVVGTKINEAYQDPAMIDHMDIRRDIVKRIVEVLEEKFMKETSLQYV